MTPKYKRILLKLAGEALLGSKEFGIDNDTLSQYADQILAIKEMGVEVAIVVGGGNIFRGIQGASSGMGRAHSDYMGMLATVMNGMALQDALERKGAFVRLQSAIAMDKICEPYIRRKAIRHLEKGRIVIFGAGTGNPFFTTDTAAALRASEMNCDALLKGTKVDGVYSADPAKDPTAKRYERLSFHQVLAEDLNVMDHAAISLARENHIPILVFSLNEEGSMAAVVQQQGKFTIVNDD